MKRMRPVVVVLLALVLAFALARGRAAHATSREAWVTTMSREEDSLPPPRPSVKLVAIHRAEGSRHSREVVHRTGMPDTLMEVETLSSSAGEGCLEILVRDSDDRTPPERLGWRARVVAGGLGSGPRVAVGAQPVGMGTTPVGRCGMVAARDSGSTDIDADERPWCTLYLTFTDWEWWQGDRRDQLYAKIVLTCIDRAGNESEPSDTVWVVAPAR